MKALLVALVVLLSVNTFAQSSPVELHLSSSITDTSRMNFVQNKGYLVLNVDPSGLPEIKELVSKTIKRPLKDRGEAHVTTITPPEFNGQLKGYVSQAKMDKIAHDLDIQSADLKLLGVGSGKKMFNQEVGETYFIIVQSKKLLEIRKAIYDEYAKKGGPVKGPNAFAPEHFYPHITIGYTHDDIHEGDGLIKSVEKSLDRRFKLIVE